MWHANTTQNPPGTWSLPIWDLHDVENSPDLLMFRSLVSDTPRYLHVYFVLSIAYKCLWIVFKIICLVLVYKLQIKRKCFPWKRKDFLLWYLSLYCILYVSIYSSLRTWNSIIYFGCSKYVKLKYHIKNIVNMDRIGDDLTFSYDSIFFSL